jgi:hypothetical protein
VVIRASMVAALATTVTVAACRFGGPSGDPEAYVAIPSDAAADATTGAPPPLDDASAVAPGVDAAAPGDDASTNDGAASDGPSDALAPPADARGCGAPIAVCDPIRNTGCNPFQQCDVDLTQTAAPTGVCVFNSGSSEGGACSSSVFSETCSPRSTCVNGACRALCSCDADCAAGECCSDTGGPPGFTLCRPCP